MSVRIAAELLAGSWGRGGWPGSGLPSRIRPRARRANGHGSPYMGKMGGSEHATDTGAVICASEPDLRPEIGQISAVVSVSGGSRRLSGK
ncbi:hypothetical protein ACFPES_23015 [Paenibacillus sp. GCM10023248]|uniref:hypothetical protein n=1 Tax=unclassified Paenibacillus TaxID=185978 RepID=UPI00237831A6|nr:hypothetical protein [Paenibacillus sp. MAHUQ-63]MDD9269930.1 hypothetical protein [Paenibacillus sp. MAHUQ-63]